jgi:hypothetical protein
MLNLTKIFYTAYRLFPFILVSFFTLSSLLNQDIKGIIYYLDKNMNVYQTEDIVSNKHNPKIIAKYIKTGDIYNIPEFNI